MNRFAISSPSGSPQQDIPKAFVTKAGAKAFQAANRISELLKDAESHLITAPFVGYCAFLSSTVHIFGIFSGNPAMEATSKRNLATNVKFLSKMKRYWGMFHWMAENLREQYRTCADAARQGTLANENSTSPIFQYGDWFDRYPHGVSGSDFVDPASYKKKEKGDDAVLEQKPELHTVEEYITTLSPPSTEGVNGRPSQQQQQQQQQAQQLKRKSIVRKSSSVSARGGQQPLEPLQTEFAHPGADMQARVHHHRTYSGTGNGQIGGQTSGPAAFNPMTISHSANGNSYHALSPISPVAVSQFSRHHGHAASFFPPDPFAIPFATHPNGMALPQLDRQLVFGAYGGGVDPGMNSLAGWAQDNAESSRQGGGGGNGDGRANGGNQVQGAGSDALHAAFSQEPSPAWFMPFNMEPPEIGSEMGVGGVNSLDGFANLFGGGGMTGLHPGGGQ
jgi:hypothetical protein